MRRLLCLGALIAAAAAHGASPARADEASSTHIAAIRALLQVDESAVDLAETKVSIDRIIDPSIDAKATLRQLDSMVQDIRARFPPDADSAAKLEALRAYLYQPGPWNGNRQFSYDLDDPVGRDIRNKLLANYLATRKGNCVSMPMLFLLLGQKLGLDVSAATAPEHVFVKFRDEAGNVTNVETTSGGFKLDETYRRDLPMTDEALVNGIYMRALGKRETVALMAVTLMEFWGREGKVEPRMALADVLLEYFPKDVTSMLHKGHSYSMMIEREFKGRYSSPGAIPPAEQARFAQLREANEFWYNKAEGLGWREPGRAQEINYSRIVERAKAASQGGK